MSPDELIAEGIVTLDFAMRFLSVSRPTLNKLIERGDLPTVVLVDKRRSIPKRALLDFAARRVQTNATETKNAATGKRWRRSNLTNKDVIIW